MNHPDPRVLTQWVHGWAQVDPGMDVAGHLRDCPECRRSVDALRAEAVLLSRALAPGERLLALKESLLRSAGGLAPRRRAWGAAFQFAAAALVLVGLFGVILWPRAHHTLDRGRVTLEDGRTLEAPAHLPASGEWKLRAVEFSSIRVADRTQVELRPEARLELGAEKIRLASGEAEFRLESGAGRRSVWVPTGRAEGSGVRFLLRTVSVEQGGAQMKELVTGVIVTVFSGTLGLANANGAASASEGQSLVMPLSEAPLLVASPQDTPEQLLKRLEKLAASIAKLEDEVAKLEARNAQLKEQLKSSAGGLAPGAAPGAFWVQGEGRQGWTVLPANPGAPGQVIIELKEAADQLQKRANERKEK